MSGNHVVIRDGGQWACTHLGVWRGGYACLACWADVQTSLRGFSHEECEVRLKGSEERAQITLKAKDVWMERAIAAERKSEMGARETRGREGELRDLIGLVKALSWCYLYSEGLLDAIEPNREMGELSGVRIHIPMDLVKRLRAVGA